MLRSLIKGNGGGKGRKRQGQLLAKTWEVVKTLASTRTRVYRGEGQQREQQSQG
jgi:hypothetical protein